MVYQYNKIDMFYISCNFIYMQIQVKLGKNKQGDK